MSKLSQTAKSVFFSSDKKANIFQRIFRVTGLEKHYGKEFLMFAIAIAAGTYWDRYDTNRMIIYRDKSALFGRELEEGEPPSWPSRRFFSFYWISKLNAGTMAHGGITN